MGHMKDLDRRIRQGGDDAIAAVSELLPRWIPVSEMLPPDEVVVLAYRNRCEYGFRRDGVWIDTLYGGVLGNGPSHWMPLPEPPST